MADTDSGKTRRDPNSAEAPPAYRVEVTPDTGDETPPRPRDFVGRFVTEIVILLVGLVIGFFWNRYSAEVGQEGHLIIALLIVIIALTRLIYYITQRQ